MSQVGEEKGKEKRRGHSDFPIKAAYPLFFIRNESRVMFIIEDENHAEWQEGEYASFQAAIAELKRRADLPWDQLPNVAPCVSWKTCGRNYEIVEFDDSRRPWKEISRVLALEISAKCVLWHIETAG